MKQFLLTLGVSLISFQALSANCDLKKTVFECKNTVTGDKEYGMVVEVKNNIFRQKIFDLSEPIPSEMGLPNNLDGKEYPDNSDPEFHVVYKAECLPNKVLKFTNSYSDFSIDEFEVATDILDIQSNGSVITSKSKRVRTYNYSNPSEQEVTTDVMDPMICTKL